MEKLFHFLFFFVLSLRCYHTFSRVFSKYYLEGNDVLIPNAKNRYPELNWTDAIEYCNTMGAYLPVMANYDDMHNILQDSM